MSKQYKLLSCTINGKKVEKMIDVRASLTDVLRDDFRLTSVKKGCEVGEWRSLQRPDRRRVLQFLHLPGCVGRGQGNPDPGGLGRPERRDVRHPAGLY